MRKKVNRKKNSSNYLNLINEFARSERSITYDDLIFSEDPEIKSETLYKLLAEDSKFLKLGILKNPENLQFIRKEILLKRLIEVNLRTEKLKIKSLSYRDFFLFFNPLFFNKLSAVDKKIILKWLKRNPILCDVGKQYIMFPHSNTIKTLNKYYYNKLSILLNGITDKNYYLYRLKSIQSKLLRKFMKVFFLSKRNRKIINLRFSLENGEKYSLEKVGDLIGLTRERIRQIEKKLKGRLKKYINLSEKKNKFFTYDDYKNEPISLLIRYIVITINLLKGSKIIPYSEKILSKQMFFVCDLLNILFSKSDRLKIFLYDCNMREISLIEKFIITEKTINLDKIKSFLNELENLNTTEKDILKLSDLILKRCKSAINLLDEIYIALKKIGRPAHYTEVAQMCDNLFKDKEHTPRNILAHLNREPQTKNKNLPWVWIGLRGVYALKEWGYERPELGIHETVVEIVRKNYIDTKRPVPFQKIFTEMVKYRKIFKKSSLIIACGCNPKLALVGRDSYIPIEYSKTKIEKVEESSIDLDNLDQILKKFDHYG